MAAMLMRKEDILTSLCATCLIKVCLKSKEESTRRWYKGWFKNWMLEQELSVQKKYYKPSLTWNW